MDGHLLKYYIHKNGDRIKDLAIAMNMSQENLSQKINGHLQFKVNEVNFIALRYGLGCHEIYDIWFK